MPMKKKTTVDLDAPDALSKPTKKRVKKTAAVVIQEHLDEGKSVVTMRNEEVTEASPRPDMPVQAETPPEKAKPKSVRLYFHSGTQAAIVAYQAATEKSARDKLYVTEILPAFQKLVENLINIHKFTSLHDTYDDLKNDCVNFLFETIRKFDATRGTNAFSYFNVVAKNWLIIRTKQKAQRIKRSVSLDDPEALSANEHRIIEDHCMIPSQDVMLENENTAHSIIKLLYEIRGKAKTENELQCINSIITIFENIDDIDLLNKSAILLYMRELSGLSPKQLTTTMQQIKKHYRRFKVDPKFKIW